MSKLKDFFTAPGVAGLGSRLWGAIRGASDGIQKNATEGLSKNAKTLYRSDLDEYIKKNGKVPDQATQAVMIDKAERLASSMKGSIGGKLAVGAAVGIPAATAVIGGAATLNSAYSGSNSTAYQAIENVMEAGKKADSESDMRGLFTRIGEGLRMLVLMFQNLGPLMTGKISAKDLFSKNADIPDIAAGKFNGPNDNGPSIGNKIGDAASKVGNQANELVKAAEGLVPNALDAGNKHVAAAEVVGVGALGAVVAAKTAGTVVSAFKGAEAKPTVEVKPTIGANTAEAVEEVAAKTKGKGWVSTIFRVGAGVAVVGGAVAASTQESKAAVNPTEGPKPDASKPNVSFNDAAEGSTLSGDTMRYGAMAVGATALGAKLVGKRIPLAGAVVTAGFVGAEVKDEWDKGNYGKMAGAAFAGAAEGLGNIIGFGVGDAARETVRSGIVWAAGEQNAPLKSDIRQIAEAGVELYKGYNAPAPALAP